MSTGEHLGDLGEDANRNREIAASTLDRELEEGHDPAVVRVPFEDARFAQTVYESAVVMRERGDELAHDPQELLQTAKDSYADAATAAILVEHRRRLDEAS